MSRRKKSSPLEDLLHALSLLPWWAGVAMAVVGYAALHSLAAPVQVTADQPGQMGHVLRQALISGAASVGQYVLPLVCLVAAVISFVRRKQRSALVADVAQATSANALNSMSWREFELMVGEAFRQQGYLVTETGGGGPDGGVDVILTKGQEKFLVQCKQWKAFKVGVSVVRELYGVMAAQGATGGFVVTSGQFSTDAKAFAEGRNIQLLDGPKLFALIKRVKQVKQPKAPAVHTQQPLQQLKNAAGPLATVPSCPLCGANMVMREARKGSNAGRGFWGCSKFPACRGSRNTEQPQHP